jgi:hypothetical protein
MSKKPAAFGAPKPLAGQAGYKLSASDILEKESTEMEVRLRMLQVPPKFIPQPTGKRRIFAMYQEKIKQQQEQADAEPKKGGSRWRSARQDKGSVTAYAKDIQEKHKTRMNEAMLTSKLQNFLHSCRHDPS